MPYIRKEIREELLHRDPVTAGELNYVLTVAVKSFLGKSPDYERYNAAVGALESAKLELYRRAIAPYEDEKRVQNGDI